MRRVLLALALLVGAPLLANPLPIQPRGSGAGTPTLGNLSATLTAGDPAGTAVVTPSISGLTGCAWTITPTTYFGQSSSTGLISTSSTPTTAGTYTPTTKCTANSGGQTITVSAALSIVANAPSYTPSLDFSDSRNSQYLPIF